MGTLRIYGTIDLSQFWPFGLSDADTTKIKLQVDTDSFEYKANGEKKFSMTKVFADAISKGQGSKPVIHTSAKTKEQTITVRLQGVDAPELHYKAAPLKTSPDVTEAERAEYNAINKSDRRQYFAESSTYALAKHLEQFASKKGIVKCTFETEVDHPFEVIDTYGRFIGNIYLKKQDINVWIVENGWGTPAFYTSMSIEEINMFLDAWTKGKKKIGRTSKALSNDASFFDWNLVLRKPDVAIQKSFKLLDDKGAALMPKIFRRQVSWMIAKKAKVIAANMSFHDFLKKAQDELYLLDDFMENGPHASKTMHLHDYVSSTNKILKDPDMLVFKEKPGTLVDGKGKKIIKW